jgi:hypothetical protein
MTDREFKITDAKGGAAFTVRCVTRANRTEAVGVQDDGSLKIRLKASPAGTDEANEELLDFISKSLNVERARIEIVAGHDGRDKLVSVEGVTTALVEEKLGGTPE